MARLPSIAVLFIAIIGLAAAEPVQVEGLAPGRDNDEVVVEQKWSVFGWNPFAAAKSAAESIRKKAEEAAAKAKEKAAAAAKASKDAAAKAQKAAADAKAAAAEAAKDPSTYALKKVLKAAGVCPTIVKATKNFLKNSIPDLVNKVADQLVGDCKALKSAGCAKKLGALSSGLLVDSTEMSMGIPTAKKLLKVVADATGKVTVFSTMAQCDVHTLDTGINSSAEVKSHLPEGAAKQITDLSKNIDTIQDTIDNVNKMVAPAVALRELWDNSKAALTTVMGFVGSKAMGQVQPHIPDSVQEAADSKKDEFIKQMKDFLNDKLGTALNPQIEKYCPDAASAPGDDEAGDLADGLNKMKELQDSIQKRLDDAVKKTKEELNKKVFGLVDTLKEKIKVPAGSGGNSSGGGDSAAAAKAKEALASLTQVEVGLKACQATAAAGVAAAGAMSSAGALAPKLGFPKLGPKLGAMVGPLGAKHGPKFGPKFGPKLGAMAGPLGAKLGPKFGPKMAAMGGVPKLGAFPPKLGPKMAAKMAALGPKLAAAAPVVAPARRLEEESYVSSDEETFKFPMQQELEGLRDIMEEDMPDNQKEQFAKLHLQAAESRARTRKLQAQNEHLYQELFSIKSSSAEGKAIATASSAGAGVQFVASGAAVLGMLAAGVVALRRWRPARDYLEIQQ